MKRFALALIVLFVTAPPMSGRAAPPPMKYVLPSSESATYDRYADLKEILKTALEKTAPQYGPYQMEINPTYMNEPRYLAELAAGQSITVAWSSTSIEKEKELLPIRVPLRKGILGYRVSLIAADAQPKIDGVKTLDDLKKLTIGQGSGWGDVKIYEANGIRVSTANYENLFVMCAAKRFDLFPRGISEAFSEQAAFSKNVQNLAVEKSLLVYYPWPFYFFFNKKDARLAERVEAGLRMMIKDGSFDAIFRKHNDASIQKADLKHRRILKLQNPILPKGTPLDDAALWFDPARY